MLQPIRFLSHPSFKRTLAVMSILLVSAGLYLLSGCTKETPSYIFRFHAEKLITLPNDPGIQGVLPHSGVTFLAETQPLLFEGDVVNIELVQVDIGLCVLFQFSDRAARALYRTSVERSGSRIFLFLNGQPIGARRFDGAIDDGNLFMFLEVADADLPKLVGDMRASLEKIKRLK